MKKKIFAAILFALTFSSSHAQIMLSPVIDSAIDGLNENNMTIAENRLRNVIIPRDGKWLWWTFCACL